MPLLTCIHNNEVGLCPSCQTAHDADPDSFVLFGPHAAGIARLRRLENLLRDERSRFFNVSDPVEPEAAA